MQSKDDVTKALVVTHMDKMSMLTSKKFLMNSGIARKDIFACHIAKPTESEVIFAGVMDSIPEEQRKHIKLLFIESNCGKPADPKANTALFDSLLTEFPNLKLVIGYSGTPDSLSAAATYFQNKRDITYVSKHKGGAINNEIPGLIKEKVLSDTQEVTSSHRSPRT